MPVLLKNYRVNDFSGRRTVYSKLKRITDTGFDTSNDFFAEGNFSRLQGLNDNSKDYFSLECNDIIKFNNLYVACGANSSTDNRTRLSTFLYSDNGGVSWTFSNDTFESGGYGLVLIVSKDNNNINTLFCGGSGPDSNGTYYGLMKSADGINWETVNSQFGEIDSMATNGSGKILAVGYDTTWDNQILQYSADNGVNWTQVLNIVSNFYNSAKISYANGIFYIGVTEYSSSTDTTILTVHTSSDLTTWTTVTFKDSENNSITQLLAELNGVYYSSVNNLDVYILYLITGGNVTPVFYSSDGVTFTASTGIDTNIYSVTNVTYNDTDNDNSFYLSVSYNDYPSPDTPIIYTSSGGESWNGIVTGTGLSSGLPSNVFSATVTGISHFFIKDSTTIIACGTEDRVSFGLVSISLSDYTVSSYGKSIVLDNGVTKLFHEDGTILVGVAKFPTSDNTIYYYDDISGKLVVTEHNEDVG